MIYLCIDLKSFYASVECAKRGLDPFKVNLVVADPSRKGAITLAITPAMKKLGIKNRCRIYEIPKDVEYICARPRMKLYMEYSAMIYKIMLKYVASEDIHVYSCDEAFLDVTSYQKLYNKNAKEIAKMITEDIYNSLHITASVGIGTNLYLAKVALDILAKHTKDNMAFLDESLYKQVLWKHQPLTDFWMIGKGSSDRLAKLGLYTMYDIAHSDINDLRKIFGINGDIIYDHSFGRENTTISDIKKYQPKSNSLSNSQILFEDYSVNDAYVVLKEMVEGMCLSLTDKGLVTNHISLSIRYTKDTIKASHSGHLINNYTNVYSILVYEFSMLYRKIVKYEAPIRQIAISVGNLKDEYYEEYDLFCDIKAIQKEKNSQKAMNEIKHKYGKNAVVRGISMLDKATARERNKMIGGHRSGE